MKKITMSDVAQVLGVSTMTVSKAYQNSPDISEAMRLKVFEAAKKIGYSYPRKSRPSIIIFTRESFISKGDTFYNELFLKLNQKANILQLQLTLNVVRDDDSISYIKDFDFSGFQGIAIMGQFQQSFLKFIELTDLPLVCIDFYDHDISADMILSNNFIASYEATAHLIKLGHHRIHFVGTLNSTSSINDRYFGYQKAMIEYNIENSIHVIDDRNGNGLKDTFQLIKPLPSAYVCNNDHSAYLLVKQLKSEMISVPDDVSVMGFDDDTYSRESHPPLSTMRVSRTYMADHALNSLILRIKDRNLPRKKISLDCELIVRDSTAPYVSDDRSVEA